LSAEARPNRYFQHEHALVESADIGDGTRVWAFAHVLPGARIGADCNICDHVFVESDVVVGDRVTVKCGVQLWDGVRLHDDVFIGPNATFTNDAFPRSRDHTRPLMETVVERGASIGANATVLPGIRIGRNAMVGAGSVVTGDVPPNAIVVGNPARIMGYVETALGGGEPSSGARATERSAPLGRRGVRIIESGTFADLRGSLSVLDYDSLPFTPARMFTVFSVPSKEVRGEHAHRRCEQLLTCVSGSVRVLWDDGLHRGEVVLDRPGTSMYMPAMVWGSQYRFENATLVVLASLPYDSDDYIRTYDEFMNECAAMDAGTV
jgi:acetyltransferase-like isoleucine patch superfamily enzyme/dTDP-4-dehydrorhamnose 3,5-epimerase-like enzyme